MTPRTHTGWLLVGLLIGTYTFIGLGSIYVGIFAAADGSIGSQLIAIGCISCALPFIAILTLRKARNGR